MSCADVRALFRQKYPNLILMSCDSELSKFTSHTHTCTGTINYYGVRLGNNLGRRKAISKWFSSRTMYPETHFPEGIRAILEVKSPKFSACGGLSERSKIFIFFTCGGL